MYEIVKRLRKSRKKWSVMARPKKKPEVRKPDWIMVTCFLVAFVAFAVMAVAYKSMKMDFEKRSLIVAEQMRVLDDVLVKRRNMIERLEHRLASTTATLLRERSLFSDQSESFIERERVYRETIDALKIEVEKQKQEIETLNKRKSKTRIIRPRDSGVVRPRVYRW